MNRSGMSPVKNRLTVCAAVLLLASLPACGGGGGGGGGSSSSTTPPPPPVSTPGEYLLAGSTCIACTGYVDGSGADARFNQPGGLAMDASGNIYVADQGNKALRKITPQGQVSTLVASGGFPSSWLAISPAGQVYLTDSDNNSIKTVAPPGPVQLFAGSSACDGGNGAAASSSFCKPSGIALDKAGNIYVADMSNYMVRKITPGGVVSTVAGTKGVCGSDDGPAASAKFCEPHGLAVDDQGNVFVADTKNSTIRKISATGQVTTVAGSAGLCDAVDGSGAAARFCQPQGLALDSSGNLYVTDTFNYTVRKITPAGVVTTVAGRAGWSDTVLGALPGGLSSPVGIVVLDSKTLAVASGHGIVKILLP